ncbi:T9SS type A sorting domain-containing protein [Aquimarina spongiae]|uniref:Por secretion system C-terminal sorting domain-containing protein n=1 Tax=Aquimarina spongiae TaxID=570521 RepID=A0A1M6CWA2_9FLAO|nr:T9SS type A sorting domain-containing protein [Aquimarina spongiae]SHI65302.1 Por secretion system C-terminal sorting domain-containing protein [Aquimarina spongiae]
MKSQLQFKNKWELVMISLFLMIVTYGQSFTVDDLRYEIISSNEVMVVDYTGTATSVNMPEKVLNNGIEYTLTHIGANAFQKGEWVESVIIPNSVRSIGRNAFGWNQLEQVTIPTKMEGVGIWSYLDRPEYITVLVDTNSLLFFEVKKKTSNELVEDHRGEMNLIVPLNDRVLYENRKNSFESTFMAVRVEQLSNDINESHDFMVYPNPARDKIHIQLKEGEELQHIHVYNTLGVQVRSSRNLQIDVSDLFNGMYILEITTKTGIKVVKRIIINKL